MKLFRFLSGRPPAAASPAPPAANDPAPLPTHEEYFEDRLAEWREVLETSGPDTAKG